MESERKEFLSLCTQFLFLNHYDDPKNTSKHEINLVLNELNAICCHQQIADQKSALVLMAAFPKIPPEEDTLVVKACCLLVSLMKKQKIQASPKIVNSNIQWLLECLERNFSAVILECLEAFSVLFVENAHALEVPFEVFLSEDKGIFTRLLHCPKLGSRHPEVNYEKNSKKDILLATLSCVETLLCGYRRQASTDIITDECLAAVGDVILKNLYKLELDFFGEVNYATFICKSLKILKDLCELHPMWLHENFGEILGSGRTFMVTGYTKEDWLKPQKVTPSQQQIMMEPQTPTISKGGKIMKAKKNHKPKHKGRKKDRKPIRVEDNSHQNSRPYSYESISKDNTMIDLFDDMPGATTSDSDMSDSGGSRHSTEIGQKKYRIRLAAIQLIQTVAQVVDHKTMFGYWHCLFSPNDTALVAGLSLHTCLLRDPSYRCRINAIQAITCLLYDSKKYLYQAENSDREMTSFTPFSVALGNMVVSIHKTLFQALDNETHSPIIVQILKCFIVLIPATPFYRLKPGLVTEMVKFIRKLISHWETTIKLLAFRVMGFIISITDLTAEIVECIGLEKFVMIPKVTEDIHKVIVEDAEEVLYSDEEEEEEEVEDNDENQKVTDTVKDEKSDEKISWILEAVLNSIKSPVSERRTMSRNTNSQSAEIQCECFNLLSALSTHIDVLMGHLEAVAEALAKGLRDSQSTIVTSSAKALDFIAHSLSQHFMTNDTFRKPKNLMEGIQFWQLLLPAITEQLQGSVLNIKVICCDALSNIGGYMYENLPKDKQFLILSLLHGNTANNEVIVRASACRALSVFAQFPSLRDDLVFFENTAEMVADLIPIGDDVSRMKAAWALGNITGSPHLKSDDPHDRLRDDLLMKMFKITIDACEDQDRVRCNIVRTMGNLLYLIREDLIAVSEWQTLVKTVVDILIVNARNVKFMKVRWNACYALGNMMKNSCLYGDLAQKHINWTSRVFPALCDLLVKNPNFKVRINATVALGIVTSRHHYGSYFISIWSSLLQGLEQANNLTDFNEYKHRDNLMDQLCFTLAHLITCAEAGDLSAMQTVLVDRQEMIRDSWQRVSNRILPERATPLIKATQKLMQWNDLPPDQHSALDFLAHCFAPSVKYYE
ncbi:HEAT repeat-containing protein 6 [Sergentomyia squamirostris]